MLYGSMTGIKLQAFIFTTAGFAFLLFGYDQGVMGGLVALPAFNERFDNPAPGLLGFMVASFDVGCLLGALCAFLFGDKLGRRLAIVVACAVLCIGATFQAAAKNRAMFIAIVGRIIAGMGVGAISTTVPVYCSECVKPRWRGKLIVCETTLVILGILVSSCSNFGFIFACPSLDGDEAQWRIPIALQMIFPIFVFCMMPFCVESPRWLAEKGRYDEVAGVLARLEGNGTTATTPEIVRRAKSIIDTAKHELEIESSWRECFEMGELQNFRRLLISGSAGFIQQATGINVVVYYAPVVFTNIGLDPKLSYIMAIVGSVFFLIGSIAPVLYIERIGRRKTMIMGSIVLPLCLGIIAACVATSSKYPDKKISAGWAASIFVLLFQSSFGVGWNSMNWLYGSEVSSLRMRNKGSATQCMFNWSINFLTVMTTPIGFAKLEWRLYLVWASVTLASVPYIWACFPETAGRTLEQMDDFFAKHQRWYIGPVANEWVEKDQTSDSKGLEKSDLKNNAQLENSFEHEEAIIV